MDKDLSLFFKMDRTSRNNSSFTNLSQHRASTHPSSHGTFPYIVQHSNLPSVLCGPALLSHHYRHVLDSSISSSTMAVIPGISLDSPASSTNSGNTPTSFACLCLSFANTGTPTSIAVLALSLPTKRILLSSVHWLRFSSAMRYRKPNNNGNIFFSYIKET